jgi:hypothetical protein
MKNKQLVMLYKCINAVYEQRVACANKKERPGSKVININTSSKFPIPNSKYRFHPSILIAYPKKIP